MTSTFFQNLKKTQAARDAAAKPVIVENQNVSSVPDERTVPEAPEASAPRPKTSLGFLLRRPLPVAPDAGSGAAAQVSRSDDSGGGGRVQADLPHRADSSADLSRPADEAPGEDEDQRSDSASADDAVAEREASGVVDGPPNFQAKLDALDALCRQETGITALNQDAARTFIKDIMSELKSSPEMSGLVIDRDLHNVMMFVQAARNQGEEKFVEVGVKRAKKETKKIAMSAMTDAFDDLLNSLGPTTPSLENLANMDTSLVPTKLNR